MDKKHQIEVLKKKLVVQKAALNKKRRIIQIYTVDLQESVARPTPELQAGSIKMLHDKYVAAHNLEESLKDANDTINEHTRQRKHLQKSVMNLQKQQRQQRTMATTHFSKITSENSILLNELNRLLKENRDLTKRLNIVRGDVSMVESNLKRLRQNTNEQAKMRQRRTQSVLHQGTKVMNDWVQEKNRQISGSRLSVVDTRGKYLHSAPTK